MYNRQAIAGDTNPPRAAYQAGEKAWVKPRADGIQTYDSVKPGLIIRHSIGGSLTAQTGRAKCTRITKPCRHKALSGASETRNEDLTTG